MVKKFFRSEEFILIVGVTIGSIVCGLFVDLGPSHRYLDLASFAVGVAVYLAVLRWLWKRRFFLTALTIAVFPPATIYPRFIDGDWGFAKFLGSVVGVALFFIAYADYRIFVRRDEEPADEGVVDIDLTEPPQGRNRKSSDPFHTRHF
ncbi:MAG: hypothetical protein UY73_C0030G0002 [Parcubacteria group bacterium GW2011_GWA2_52_8]|nr:MAG: hypothetical protein UY73_C0030G0002 [Parcubacteria group bacterium GW2011_GWA2_52_8]